MVEKIHIDPVLGEVTLRRNPRARRISIRVHPVKGVVVTVPWTVPYRVGIAFLESRREWVLSMRGKVEAEMPEGIDVEALRPWRKRSCLPGSGPWRTDMDFDITDLLSNITPPTGAPAVPVETST